MIMETLRRMRDAFARARAVWKVESMQCTMCRKPLPDNAKKYSQCSLDCQIDQEEFSRAI